MILTEQTVEKYKILESYSSGNLPKGVLSRVAYPVCNIDKINRNNRIYERKLWDSVMENEDVINKMDKRCLFGHAEHPSDTTQSNLEKTSHVITKMWIDEDTNTLYQQMDVLDTPYGKIVNTLLEAECQVGVSTRAEGEIEDVNEGDKRYSRVVPESYMYISTDFTADPSTFNTYPEKVTESIVNIINESVEQKTIDETYATTLLESIKPKVEDEVIKEPEKKLVFECLIDMAEYIADKFDEIDEETKDMLRNSIIESISVDSLNVDVTNLKISEASARAEVETLLEALTKKDNKIKSVNEQRDMELNILSNKLSGINENKDVSVKEYKAKIKTLENKLAEIEKEDAAKVKELEDAAKKAEKEHEDMVLDMTKGHEEELSALESTYKESLTKVQEAADKEIIKKYVELKLDLTNVELTEKNKALLESCESTEEVNRKYDKMLDILCEKEFHSDSVIKVEEKVVLPTKEKVFNKSMDFALGAMFPGE